MLNIFKKLEPFQDIKEIRKENSDEDRIIRDLRALYEPEEDYYKPQNVKSPLMTSILNIKGMEIEIKKFSIGEYLDMIRPYLGKIINDHKDGWKIQLAIEISFVSSVNNFNENSNKDSYVTYSKNSSVFFGYETDNIIEKAFESLLKEYQTGLEIKMKKSDFVFDGVDALFYKLHKISLNKGGSYIDSPKWLKDKKATINPKNKKADNCFQYAIAVALNYQNIKNNPERISKIKPSINKYNWKGINFPSHKEDWNNFEKNNKSIALNVLFVPHYTKQIRHAYLSKYNSDRKNQVILLMITDGKK